MAMNMSSTGGVRSDINITPLVDVVLVLLIIFMVAVPLLQMGYPAQVPPKVTTATPPPSEDQIIVRMDAAGQTYINKLAVPYSSFGGALQQALTGRQSKVVFFAADGEQPLVAAIDLEAGAHRLHRAPAVAGQQAGAGQVEVVLGLEELHLDRVPAEPEPLADAPVAQGDAVAQVGVEEPWEADVAILD